MKPKAEQRIRERAYFLWESEGRPEGKSGEYWDQAARIELGWRYILYRWPLNSAKWMAVSCGSAALGYLLGLITLRPRPALSEDALLLLIGVILVTCVSSLLVILVPRLQARKFRDADPDKYAWSINEYRKTLGSIVAGMLVIVGFFLTMQQIAATFEKDIGERFTKSVEELGNASPDIRIGAIYGFGRIFRDAPANQGSIIEILSAFVRQRARIDNNGEQHLAGPLPDVMAALRTIDEIFKARNSVSNAIAPLNLSGADLSESELAGFNWPGAYLVKTRFDQSDLSRTVLRNANLQYASFDGAVLREADLVGADVLGASFRGTDLTYANLTAVKNLTADQLKKGILSHTIFPDSIREELRDVPH